MFSITHTQPNARGLMVVTLAGNADMSAVNDLDRGMLIVSAVKPSTVIFDLSGVTFVCSLTLGSLVAARHGVKTNGGRCILAGPVPDVERVIVRSRLDSIFEIKPTLEEAMMAAAAS